MKGFSEENWLAKEREVEREGGLIERGTTGSRRE